MNSDGGSISLDENDEDEDGSDIFESDDNDENDSNAEISDPELDDDQPKAKKMKPMNNKSFQRKIKNTDSNYLFATRASTI